MWEEVKLGDVVNLKRGYDLPAQNRTLGELPIYSSSGITDYHNKAMKSGPGVITGRYGTIGKVFYSEQDYWPLSAVPGINRNELHKEPILLPSVTEQICIAATLSN